MMDGLPVIQNVQEAITQQSRNDSTIHSATLNVRQPALNLNSAISITPTSSQRKQQEQGQFAVPQNKQNKSPINDQVERPQRPPTVDLTQDTPPQMPVVRCGRPPRALLTCEVCDKNFQNQNMLTQHMATHFSLLQMPVVRRDRPPRALLTCQVCNKNFQNQNMLTQHMATHRTTNKLLYRCNLCSAQYVRVKCLTKHKRIYHKVEVDTVAQNEGSQLLALPVVDLKSSNVLNRLMNLGIQSYIPLSQLIAQTGGYFGLPIIDGARNTNICNLDALGATSILSLGPLKHISKG